MRELVVSTLNISPLAGAPSCRTKNAEVAVASTIIGVWFRSPEVLKFDINVLLHVISTLFVVELNIPVFVLPMKLSDGSN